MPFGILCILFACWGVNQLIGLSPISFPASVALLILHFFGLMASQALLGDRRTKALVRVIDVPVSNLRSQDLAYNLLLFLQGGFALRYINVFFTPSFGMCPALQGRFQEFFVLP